MSNSPTTAPVLVPRQQDLSALNTLGLAATAEAYVSVEGAAQLPTLSALAARSGSLLVLGLSLIHI